MLRFTFALIAMIPASPAMATITAEGLRNLAYAGDVHTAETALTQAHRHSLDGTISFDDLRGIVSGLLTSHPDVNTFTADWLVAYPESPYAMAIRANQIVNAAWDVRGDKFVYQTHPIALSTFSGMQAQAMELARDAYALAPDFVPASDAIFNIQFAHKALSEAKYYEVLSDVMQATADYGSLQRAMRIHLAQWGGRGNAGILDDCAIYAPQVAIEAGFDADVCAADFIWQYGSRRDDNGLMVDVKNASDHPTLDKIRFGYDTHFTTDKSRRLLVEYLSRPDVTDYEVASRFYRNYQQDDESRSMLEALDERLQAQAEAALPHNPYSPKLIHVLTRSYQHFTLNKTVSPDRLRALRQRLVVARPFDPDAWSGAIADVATTWEQGGVQAASPFFVNAIVYSQYETTTMLAYLGYHLRIYESILSVQEDTGRTLPPAVLEQDALCPITRLTRLLRWQCTATGTGDTCLQSIGLSAADQSIIISVVENDMCPAMSALPLPELLFEPVLLELPELEEPMANR